jgi:DNA repair protein RadD
MTRQLYPHQERTLAMLRHSIARGNRRILICCPTGSGKSVVKAVIIRDELAKSDPVLVTVPSITLVDQMVRILASEGVHELGDMQANHKLTAPMMLVQVACLATFARRGMAEPGIVLVDEAHINNRHLARLMKRWRNSLWLGWTATPGTERLGLLYDDLLIPTTTKELIETGHLSAFKVFAPSHPNLSGIKMVAGDYKRGQLSERMCGSQLVADVVETWLRLGRGRPTLVFAVDRAHAKVLQQRFLAAGVRAEYVDAKTSGEERDVIRERMERGETEVTVNIGCLTTGCDWPFVSCVVLARPTKSVMLYVQIVGRGLRTYPGKEFCLILDHSDTTLQHGFVTEIEWGPLDRGSADVSGVRHKETVKPQACVRCHALMPKGERRCPECGHVIEVPKVRVGDGDLVELSRTKVTMLNQQSWFSQLLWIAEQHGHEDGWVAHTFRRKFGQWPRDLDKIANHAGTKVRRYVRHQLISYAKTRSGRNAT